MISFLSITPALPRLSGRKSDSAWCLETFPRRVMRHPSRGLRPSRDRALRSFTLIEVVLAIAVIAFVLVSILGLMTYSQQLVKQADTYSRLSNVAAQVLGQFDRQPFAISTNCAATNAVYYFSYEGLPTNSTAAYFQCNVTNANLPHSLLTNVMQIQLNICWPVPVLNNTNVVITSTLNYD
jgi:type II secretory pathway pseudopilin PulG